MRADRLIALVAAALVAAAMLWGACGHTQAKPCDSNYLPDKHGANICGYKP